MKIKKWSLVGLAFFGLVVSLLLAKGIPAFALNAADCLATIDFAAGTQTNPACPAPGPEASNSALIASLRKLDPDCPLPTVQKGHQCVLEGDVTLSAPLNIDSFTHLNCQGHRILSRSPGTGTFPNDPASNPEVAIVLDQSVYGVKIQNCLIGGADGETGHAFDFGIYARSSKLPSEVLDDPGAISLLSSKIMNNTINGRYSGIGLSNVDNTMITGNTINLLAAGPNGSVPGSNAGIGIGSDNDSDGNKILDNHVTRKGSGAVTLRRDRPGRIDPPTPSAFGIRISSVRGTATRASIVSGVLDMVPQSADHPPLNEDNVVDGNTVDMNRGSVASTAPSVAGILLSDFSTRTEVHDNILINAPIGVAVATNPAFANTDRLLPGMCTGGTADGRICGRSLDCFILSAGDTSALCAGGSNNLGFCDGDEDCPGGTCGTCSGTLSVASDPLPHDSVVERNTVTNSVIGMWIQTAVGLTLQGNTIIGSVGEGINLGGSALGSETLITRNILSNNQRGLFLTNPVAAHLGVSPTSFDAQVTLNDITGGSQAVGKTAGYILDPTELSVLGSGNYWGRTSCPGFIPGVDSPEAFIVDSASYITPVAATGTGTQCP